MSFELFASREKEILQTCFDQFDPTKKNEIIKKLIFDVVPRGKKTRAYITFFGFPGTEIEHFRLPYLNEIFQASCLILDDIMDNSELRRGEKAWHIQRGPLAIKDAFFLLSCCFKFNIPTKLRKILAETALRTSLGQTGDCLSSYSLKSYFNVCTNKNGWYTFYLPIAIPACILNFDCSDLEEFSSLCGRLHQMQDDFLNFFPEISKKSCSDLQEKKATWFTCYLKEKFDVNIEDVTEEMIREIFPIFYEEEDRILMKIQEISENSKIYGLCYELLLKRRYRPDN